MTDNEELFDEPRGADDLLVASFENDETKSGFYYAYCSNESKRIGNYEGDRQVAVNRANHHTRITGHSTNVYRK